MARATVFSDSACSLCTAVPHAALNWSNGVMSAPLVRLKFVKAASFSASDNPSFHPAVMTKWWKGQWGRSKARCHNGPHRLGRRTQYITDLTKAKFVDIDAVLAIGLFQYNTVYCWFRPAMEKRSTRCVLSLQKVKTLQGQTNMLKERRSKKKEIAQGVQIELQMWPITKTNGKVVDVIIWYRQHAHWISQQQRNVIIPSFTLYFMASISDVDLCNRLLLWSLTFPCQLLSHVLPPADCVISQRLGPVLAK